MKAVIFVLLCVILGLIYFIGLVPKTVPFYEKKFNDFYLGLLSATTNDEVLFWLDYQEDLGFVNYIQNNEFWIQKRYPRHLLSDYINPKKFLDKYGNPVIF